MKKFPLISSIVCALGISICSSACTWSTKAYRDYALFDLHVHLDGAISAKTIIQVAKQDGVELPTTNAKELQKYISVDENCTGLEDYLTKFEIPNKVLQTEYGLKECADDVLARFAKQGIKYTELRMAPQKCTEKGLSQDKVVSALLDVINKSEESHKIKSRLILCMMREGTKEDNKETIDVAKKYLGQGVVSIDLAGLESKYPNELFVEEFLYAKEQGVPYTIGAGQDAGYESVNSALDLGAVRISHGIRSLENKDTMKRLKQTGTPLTLCPKSYIDTNAIEGGIKNLNIKKLLSNGVKVTLNTGNPTVSDTTLKYQYEMLNDLGVSVKQAKQIALNSIEASFLNEEEKAELREYVK